MSLLICNPGSSKYWAGATCTEGSHLWLSRDDLVSARHMGWSQLEVAAGTASERDVLLQMKNPVFPSVVLQERMSMLHFLRLSRVR